MAIKFKCPFCNVTGTREYLVSHVDEEHEDMIPKDYTAARVVFNHINHKNHGTCVVCKKETEWNEKTWKYNRLCGRPKCREALRKKYQENMIKVYKTDNILNDPMQQEKMLANRKISGKYKFADGGVRTYTGSYEHKTLEFMDKVMNIPSSDIMSPGPIFEYEYKGQKLKWITDILYIPANLVIEVKDGGSNPNNRSMKSYREKQLAKEQMITELGTYNYLRLTDNNFEQLLEILAELKYQMIDDDKENKKVIISINEEVGGIPPSTPFRGDSESDSVYIVPYGFNNVFSNDVEDYGFIRSLDDEKMLIVNNESKLETVDMRTFLEHRNYDVYKYTSDTIHKKIKLISEAFYNKYNVYSKYLLETVIGQSILVEEQFLYYKEIERVDLNENATKNEILESTVIHQYKHISGFNDYFKLINKNEEIAKSKILEDFSGIDIQRDKDGFFAIDETTNVRTRSYSVLNEINENILKCLEETSRDSAHNDLIDALSYSARYLNNKDGETDG